MSFDYRQVKQFRDNLEQLDRDKNEFLQSCAKDLAARLLALTVKRTPKDTGTLKRGWTVQSTVRHVGDTYIVEIINPVEYASYVEYGHRTRNHTGWVKGKWMMTVSEKEIQAAAPQILEKKLEKWLRGCLNGK